LVDPIFIAPELTALNPVPDSRFFSAGPNGRLAGGLFALDGVHPTTLGYGLIAQELVDIMETAGMEFYSPNGKTKRTFPLHVDFARLIALDSLISHPRLRLVPISS
jgi:hypothetical protein